MTGRRWLLSLLFMSMLVVVHGCDDDDSNPIIVPIQEWVWIAGDKVGSPMGVYGVKGIPDPANAPGGRLLAMSWVDSNQNYWVFGGFGKDSTGTTGSLNDLWRFDGTNWTWVHGSNVINQLGNYGVKGVPDPANVPGARETSYWWTDSLGNFWLFGGDGYGASGGKGLLNDLWRFDGTNWTWIAGPTSVDQMGVYGALGVPDPANVPGGRGRGAMWIDASDDLWVFGGGGFDGAGLSGTLNDLWRFDGTNWTWMGGSQTRNLLGVYGTKGVSDPANNPAQGGGCAFWRDSGGDFWLFGGSGNGEFSGGFLNSLWNFDGTDWTWVSGSNFPDLSGVYGIQGTADPANVPGGRDVAASWIDSSNNLWVFGGNGYDSTGGPQGELNDLWRFDGTDWTWMAGSNLRGQAGVYGTQGIIDPTNQPGARCAATFTTDTTGAMWMFGGFSRDEAGSLGNMNDLWKFVP